MSLTLTEPTLNNFRSNGASVHSQNFTNFFNVLSVFNDNKI